MTRIIARNSAPRDQEQRRGVEEGEDQEEDAVHGLRDVTTIAALAIRTAAKA
jgi:hypothetical protein